MFRKCVPIFKQPDLVGRVPPLKLTLLRLDRLVSEERGLSMALLTKMMREKIEGEEDDERTFSG